MTVFRWNSLQDLFAIQEKVNRLFEETMHRTEFPDDGLDAALWSPAADVYETPEAFVMLLELAGVEKEDVEIQAEGDVLTVRGERRLGAARPESYHRMERTYGTFSRSFHFPAEVAPVATGRDGLWSAALCLIAEESIRQKRALPIGQIG